MDVNDLSDDIYDAVFQYLGEVTDEEMTDSEVDSIIRKMEMCTGKELFSAYLNWHGIIGFTEQIIEAYEGTIGRKDGK
jgi:hypothetical protein